MSKTRLQMSCIRQLAAAFLLVLMVPSLVLAALPLRYCVGPSGHQAIEFVIEGVSHSGADTSHASAAQAGGDGCDGASVFADSEKCTDKALMDTASSPPSVDLKLLSLTAVLATALALPPALPVLSPLQTVVAPSRDHPHVDPRMEIRRSVVLLI